MTAWRTMYLALAVATLLWGLPTALPAANAALASKPNIVFFLVDDMGWQETSVPFHTEITALNHRYRTPHMERLAAQGMKFTQAYASAVCSPTRVSALKPFEATLASMIEGMDKSLGDLLAALDRLGVADNTVILFMSDNGSPSNCPRNLPLRGHKLTPYEGGIREPMIVKWPGVTKPATVCHDPVVIEDFFPTILELAGADWRGTTVQTVDGVSFVPLLKGQGQTPAARAFVWHFPHNYSGQGPFSSLRQGPWKLIYHHADGRLELFNIDDDIGETRNLAKDQPAKVTELAMRLTERLRETNALMPLNKATGKPVALPGEVVPKAAVSVPKPSAAKVPESSHAKALVWQGIAIEEPDFTIWGASPILADGKAHLFAARWPEANVDPAWRKSSEIAHYVADHPEGPFRFHRVVVQGTGRTGAWDAFAPHNPEIRRFGDTFALCYIANSDFHQPPHPLNQQIGMVVSESVNGPWRKVGQDGLILGPSPDPQHFSHGKQVVNPTLLKVGDKFHLYFKTRGSGGTLYGLALADDLTGPYRMLDRPITTEGVFIEDASGFAWDGKICLFTTDNHGAVTGVRGGGALWVSDDGTHFKPEWTQLGFDRIPRYYVGYAPDRVKRVYGGDPKLERPKVLCVDGRPAWLYAPSGWNVTGGQRTVSHVLRINLGPEDGPLTGLTGERNHAE